MKTNWILSGLSGNGQRLYAINDDKGVRMVPNSFSRATMMTHAEAKRLRFACQASYKGITHWKISCGGPI